MLSLENVGVYLTGVASMWTTSQTLVADVGSTETSPHRVPIISERPLTGRFVSEQWVCTVVVASKSKDQEGELHFFRSLLLGTGSDWLSFTSGGGRF